MRYPTWAVESVPMIYLAPVVIAVAHWVSKPQLWASLIATAIAVVGSALGKVVAVTVLGPVGLAAAALRVVELRGLGSSLQSRPPAVVRHTPSCCSPALLIF